MFHRGTNPRVKSLRQRHDQRGFTLLELVVVMAIIALLATLVLAALSGAQKGARDTRRKSDLNQYKSALAQFNGTYQTYPDDGGSCIGSPTGITATTAPYGNAGQNLQTGGFLNQFIGAPQAGGTGYQYYGYCFRTVGSDKEFTMWTRLERSGRYFCVGPSTSKEDAVQANCLWPG